MPSNLLVIKQNEIKEKTLNRNNTMYIEDRNEPTSQPTKSEKVIIPKLACKKPTKKALTPTNENINCKTIH